VLPEEPDKLNAVENKIIIRKKSFAMMVISIWVKNGAPVLDSYVANFSLFETGKEDVKSFIIHHLSFMQ
jgi:hypothetical protein